MRHLRRSSAAVLAVLLMFCAYMGFRYWKEHTPEAALAHIGHAAAAEDRDGFDQYVDTDAVLAGLSEDAAALLAENIDALHARHPWKGNYEHVRPARAWRRNREASAGKLRHRSFAGHPP